MTNTEWAKCVIVLRAIYQHTFKLDTEAQIVWFEMLSDLDGEAVINAIRHMAKTQPAFPSIADIRKLAEPPAPDASSAWLVACRYVSALALGRKMVDGVLQELPQMADAAIAAAVEAVGREAIRMREPENEGVLRAHFAKAYEARVMAGRREAAGLPIAAPVSDILAESRRALMRALPEVN